ncbi:MAG TPA: hypothetical protein VD704_07530 [Gaiellaceae bacterium]|nr:hypothetical protein [Gaiellaceae bacterium]
MDAAPFVGTFKVLMSDDLSLLLHRVRLLLDRRGERTEAHADAVELTLTDGYARALALEGERRRLDARILELAGGEEHAAALRELKSRAEAVDDELGELRGALTALASTLQA